MTAARKLNQKRYCAVKGARITDKDAEVVGPVMDSIAAACGGRVRPRDVLREARSPKSPLHQFFEWDDKKAAESQRLEQARYLIRSITIVVTNVESEEESVRALHLVVEEGERSYAPIETVLSSRDLLDQLLVSAHRDLDAWARRYSQLSGLAELKPVFDAVSSIKKSRDPK